MTSIHPFPYIHPEDEDCILNDGNWIVQSEYCKKRFKERCEAFYNSIRTSPGPHRCPCGLSCYVNIDGGEWVIYTSLRINQYFDRDKTKHILTSEYSPQFPLEVLENIIDKTHQTNLGLMALEDKDDDIRKRSKVNEDFINVTIHEIRKLNSQIKAQSEELSRALDYAPINMGRLEYLQKNIFATSSLISMRLNAYDFQVNPELIEGQKPQKVPVYKKFDKISHCLRIQQTVEGKKIYFDGESNACIWGYEIFDMLPFVILDNAIKFSPPYGDIRITFFEKKKSLSITINNIGPELVPGEENKVFEEFYRGEFARNISTGSGLGLSFAKQICDLHKIKISVDSKPFNYDHLFIVTLEFDPQTLC